ncbi:N-6 DNA methylase [Schaalia hyovaginalis]|nr:N-6 DNA methylase [Schaalia hyovaginalis]
MTRLWPQGMLTPLDASLARLRMAKPAFDRAWDAWDLERDSQSAVAAYAVARDLWVETVLREVLDWGPDFVHAEERPLLEELYSIASDGYPSVRVTPTGACVHGDEIGALVLVVDPVDSLRDAGADGWAASPIDRMAAMLRSPASACSIGVVTDGRWWALVSAPRAGATASGVVDSQTWVEEPATRNAFFQLLTVRHLLGAKRDELLPVLFADSVLAAEEITESLGTQVRRAVELVVTALSEAAVASSSDPQRGSALPEDPGEVYEAVVTMMMRTVFLLFAEERGLLSTHDLYLKSYGLSGVLDELEERARDEGEESMDGTSLTWHRLLAAAQALHDGVNLEDMRIPAYGGSLFDGTRFPFLTARDAGGSLRVSVSDRVMLHVLRSVQTTRTGKGKDLSRLSFRDLDVEQIGYIYEGLLGYTCERADETILGLIGSEGDEPEVPLSVLEDLAEKHPTPLELAEAVRAWLKEKQSAAKPPTAKTLEKGLRAGSEGPEAERALLSASRDAELRERLSPWVGVIRRDLRGRLVVIEAGGLLVVETPSRRHAGAHYTPRALAEEVVRHALEPLVFNPGPRETEDRASWRPVKSDELLKLRVADIACGSGAFLVAAARFLAYHLLEAWHREGVTGDAQAGELRILALRKVVSRCLYGVDINEMAVEMCKLSLWLVSLDRDKPFSFVDDKVFHGNSLLGIRDRSQLEALHIDPARAPGTRLFELDRAGRSSSGLDLEGVLSRVVGRRNEIASVVDNEDPTRSARKKRRLQDENEAELDILKAIADAVVATALDPAIGAAPGRKLDEAYENLALALMRAYPEKGEGDPRMLEGILERGLTPTVETDYERWRCLHWPLAVPEVLERGGFDAIIGNPPFLGGKKISSAMGENIREWFVDVLADGARGHADLVAYFFLRAFSLLHPAGMLGLIATNTLAQGDTREVGLDRMIAEGFTITRAIQSRPWSASSANLEYAAVWGTRGALADGVWPICEEQRVRRISTLLEPEGRVSGPPIRLEENEDIPFIGCYVLGRGFVLEPNEAQEWISEDPRNAEVLFPYLNGEDLNSRPDTSASRWVIDFNDWSEEHAAEYPTPYRRLCEVVRPKRQRLKADGSFALRKPLPQRWWQYGDKRPAMRNAIAGLGEVLVIALVSKTVMPMRVSTGQVFSHALGVFATESFAIQAVLSSSLHQDWAITYGSTLETRVRYTPSDIFETFPRPKESETLERIGRILDEERREIMLRRELGLTALYNRVNEPDIEPGHDPDIDRIREIHRELDELVAAAYGWEDLDLNHGFHSYRKMTRWTVSPEARLELLDRLLEENHRRAAAEAAAVPATGRRGKRRIATEQETLDV